MFKRKKVTAIIQARYNSTRLPGKVLKTFLSKTVLHHIAERISRSVYVDEIVFAIGFVYPHSIIEELYILKHTEISKKTRCEYFIGSEERVMKRVFNAAKHFRSEIIVEITGDCPLVDPTHIDKVIKGLIDSRGNESYYSSNIDPRTWPDGFDVQAYTFDALETIYRITKEPKHVGWHIQDYRYNKSKFNYEKKPGLIYNFKISSSYSNQSYAPKKYAYPEWGLTLDTPEDYLLLTTIFKHFGHNHFSAEDVMDFLLENTHHLKINQHIRRKSPEEG